MSNPSPITITYWEGDETHTNPFTKLFYCEWKQDGIDHHAYADESRFNWGEGDDTLEEIRTPVGIEHRGIPLEVRRAIAEIVFPPLKGFTNV